MEEVTITAKCACGEEEIRFVYASGESDKYYDPYIGVSIWERSFGGNAISWSEKFRHIWHILRRGSPWCEWVILKPSTLKRLGEDLIKLADRAQKEATDRGFVEDCL